jgi:hypothetical protein
MAVTGVFEFDSAEYLRATRAISRFTHIRWIGWAFGSVAFALVAATFYQLRDEAPSLIVANVLPWFLLGVFWLSMVPLMQWWSARTVHKRDASVLGPQERTVDEAGFHTRGNGVALDIPWHAMVRGVESAEFFLFFYSKQLAYYLPKRALDAQQVEHVRSLMRSGLSERAKLLET